MLSLRPRFALLATTAAVGIAAVAGTAIADEDPTGPPDAAVSPAATPLPVGAVEPDQARAFRVLRRPQRHSDAMPADLQASVAGPGRFGRNADLARAVQTATGQGWVVPGRGAICLVVPDPVDGYATSCTATETAAQSGVQVQLVSPDASSSSMLLPDDGRLVVTNEDHTADAVAPDASGVATADTDEAERLTVVTDEGRSTTPVPNPDGTVPDTD